VFGDTVTIFNRRHTKDGDTWYPHVLHGVEFENDKASIMQRYGVNFSDSAMIVINCKETQEGIEVEGIPYLPPKQWAGLGEDGAATHITFNDNAQLFDFLIKGDYGGMEAVKDSDYKGGFYTYMNRAFDYCYCITGVGGPYKLIPHFRILAK
jgi:hypothetical protein